MACYWSRELAPTGGRFPPFGQELVRISPGLPSLVSPPKPEQGGMHPWEPPPEGCEFAENKLPSSRGRRACIPSKRGVYNPPLAAGPQGGIHPGTRPEGLPGCWFVFKNPKPPPGFTSFPPATPPWVAKGEAVFEKNLHPPSAKHPPPSAKPEGRGGCNKVA